MSFLIGLGYGAIKINIIYQSFYPLHSTFFYVFKFKCGFCQFHPPLSSSHKHNSPSVFFPRLFCFIYFHWFSLLLQNSGLFFLSSITQICLLSAASFLLSSILTDVFNLMQVGDFATVCAAPSGASQTVKQVSVVIGTPVYLAPEAIRFDVSTKLDSYSFGVVILEVITGKFT